MIFCPIKWVNCDILSNKADLKRFCCLSPLYPIVVINKIASDQICLTKYHNLSTLLDKISQFIHISSACDWNTKYGRSIYCNIHFLIPKISIINLTLCWKRTKMSLTCKVRNLQVIIVITQFLLPLFFFNACSRVTYLYCFRRHGLSYDRELHELRKLGSYLMHVMCREKLE